MGFSGVFALERVLLLLYLFHLCLFKETIYTVRHASASILQEVEKHSKETAFILQDANKHPIETAFILQDVNRHSSGESACSYRMSGGMTF